MTSRAGSNSLDRREAVRELLRARGDLLVITGLGSPAYDVFAAGDNDANFYLWGAMGGAAMMGMALAFAQPSRPVAVITGDGEQLMGLGSLATIAAHKPANLSLVVLDNGHFGETGMQQSHTGLGIDLCRIADAAGMTSSVELRDLEAIRDYRPNIGRTCGGPRFVSILISAESVPRALPPRDGAYLGNRFRAGLGLPVE